MDRIVEYFRAYVPVSDEAWDYFKKRLTLTNYRSGDVITPTQRPCSQIGFILEGISRSYLQRLDGKDYTWFFHYYENNNSAKQFILIDYPSFNLQTPSIYGFQALSDCKIARMSHHDLCDVFKKYPDFLSIEKHLVVNAYQRNNERVESLLTKSALERLEEFMHKQECLFSMIPHYHIASYLGITPQRLCQLRSSVSNSKKAYCAL